MGGLKITMRDACAADFSPKSQFAIPVQQMLVEKRAKVTMCDACAANFGPEHRDFGKQRAKVTICDACAADFCPER